MPQSVDVVMRFTDGTEIKAFDSFTLSERFLDPIDRFSCRLRPGKDHFARYRDLTRKGELIGLNVAGHPQAAMMIETVTTTVSPSAGLVIDIQAVSTLKLLMEGYVSIADSKRLDADEPIIDLVSNVADDFGFDEVQADDDIATLKSKTGKDTGAASKNGSPKQYKTAQTSGSETAYSFLNRVLSRNNMMLRQHATGALIVTAPHYDGKALYCVREAGPGGPKGDVLEGDIVEQDSNEGQFSFVETNGVPGDDDGEKETGAPTERVESSAINSNRPPFRATGFINYKPCYYKDDNAKDAKHAKNVSTLILGKAAERAYQIRCRVPALVSRDGIPWTVDTMCRVYIPTLGLDEEMWIAERVMKRDVSSGQMTELTLSPKGYVVIGDT